MAIHIGRREFVVTLGGAVALPFGTHAQQATVPVIGVIGAVYIRFIQVISALPYLTRVSGDRRAVLLSSR